MSPALHTLRRKLSFTNSLFSGRTAKREDISSRRIRKSDWDNIGKLVCDALNGVAYDDDKCVCDARVVKLYGEVPHLRVRLEDINAWDLRQPGTAGGEQ